MIRIRTRRFIMRWQDIDQHPCSLARTLAIIGDNWTLLVLRDCFMGVRRFDDFQQRLGVTRHVLSDRLRKLTEGGVLDKDATIIATGVREGEEITEPGLEAVRAGVQTLYRRFGYDRAQVQVETSDTDDALAVLLTIKIKPHEPRTISQECRATSIPRE